MKDNAPDVPISISRQTPAPGFDRIHRFQAAGESQILNRFNDERRGFIDPAAIRIQADNNGGVKSELNIPGGGDTHGLLRIGPHLLGVMIDSSVFGAKNLIFPSPDFRPPLFAALVQIRPCFFGVH